VRDIAQVQDAEVVGMVRALVKVLVAYSRRAMIGTEGTGATEVRVRVRVRVRARARARARVRVRVRV
jgi:hypothetical protein